MHLTEFADPEIYRLAARDATDLLDQIDRMPPGGISDDTRPLVRCLTKRPPTGERKLLDGL